MPIDCEALRLAALDDQPVSYTKTDAMLYALGLGFASDPRDPKELPYVFEQPRLKTVPTFATALLDAGFPAAHGWDGRRALPLEQKLDFYRPLPASGSLLANRRVVHVEPPGSRIVTQSEVRLAIDDTAVFSLSSVLVPQAQVPDARRGEAPGGLVQHRLPSRDPDLSCDIATRGDQSLLFRLCGDANALYADPDAAREAGFETPPLHPQCLFGIACRAVLKTICDFDYTLITGIEARFAEPARPGDVITTDMWQDRNVVSFRCLVRGRDAVVIDVGRCTLAG